MASVPPGPPVGASQALVCLMCSVFYLFCNPITTCQPGCNITTKYRRLDFMHVSDLENKSVAPWELIENIESGREPESILTVKCKPCNLDHHTSKPIHIQVWVYKVLKGTKNLFCRCPIEVAVGCTCVKEETQ